MESCHGCLQTLKFLGLSPSGDAMSPTQLMPFVPCQAPGASCCRQRDDIWLGKWMMDDDGLGACFHHDALSCIMTMIHIYI